MSKGKIIVGMILVIIVLAVLGSMATPKNTPAPTTAPPAASGAAPTVAASSTAAATGTYGVGDRVKLADEQFMTLEKAETGYTSDLVKPEAGNVNVSFLVAFEGINPDGSSYNPFYFKVMDDGGFEYNFNAFGKEPMLAASNTLQPGKIARGWVTFEVPKTAKTLTLSYTPGFTGEPVEFVYKP